jgi:ABC-2 type transport system ATP-binding protein
MGMPEPQPGAPAIEAVGVTKRFRASSGAVDAVHDLTLSVDHGERLAFIGPNGAGKSTSIKMLTGILHPTAGSARVLGLVPWQQRRRLSERTGTLFGQRSQLWFELSARQSLRMLAAVYGMDRAQEQRRVAELGDLLAKRRFRELLVTLNEAGGTTVFLTSHDVADIEHVAQRVVVISSGRLIYDDSVSAMRRTMLSTKLVDVGLERAGVPLELEGVTVLASDQTFAQLSVDTSRTSIRDVLGRVLDTWSVSDISVVDPPLEQVIVEIYAERQT